MTTARPLQVLRGHEGSYALLEIIGKGAFGTVFKGIWREVGRHVAIKRVSRSRLSTEEEKSLQTEIHLFKNLKHQHIVNYIEAVDDPASSFLDIVMEYVEGGSLFNVVQSIRKSLDVGERVFDEPVVADFIRQVVLGLKYLHHQGVVHRDIKGANILVTKESHVKLADFGVASTKPADLTGPIDVAGSPYWMAPEIITLTGSSTASDIWSLGCTVIELLTGFPPYHEFADVTALFRIVSDECPPLPPNLSADLEDFLRSCFNKDMHTRASADELLAHRWLVREHVAEELLESPNESHPLSEHRRGSDVVQPTAEGISVFPHPFRQNNALDMYEEADDEDFGDLDFGDDISIEDDAKFTSALSPGVSVPISEEISHFKEVDDNRIVNRTLSTDIHGNSLSILDDEDSIGQMGDHMDDSFRRLSMREDPFKDLMDDPEADLERERLRKQKEMWELVKTQAKGLGKSEEVHVAACDALVHMFKENPEQRYYLIYDPGLLPIIEVLESGGNGSTLAVEAMLRVTLSFLDDNTSDQEDSAKENMGDFVDTNAKVEVASFGYPRVSNIREDLCLAGFLPVVMRYCGRSESAEARLLSARFLEKMLELERALHMFIACRGFSSLVDMLEPDIVKTGELSRIALGGIDRMLSMENQRHKRDFCRRFAWSGLLERIVNGISHNMNYLKSLEKEEEENSDVKAMVLVHVTKLAKLLQTFAARADHMVKARMTRKSVLDPIIQQIANVLTPDEAIQCILCCVRDLSRDPQTHLALQSACAIETLVQYLCVDSASLNTKVRHLIISSLHNLCIVSPARQEAAARAGLVPHLQRYIDSQDMNLRSLCIDMYSGLACAGQATRVELGKHNGVDFYVELLVLLSVPGTVRKWQARVLQSVSEWLEDEEQCEFVENSLVLEKNRRRVCNTLARMRILDVEGVLEPYLKMITISEKMNYVFGKSEVLVSAMVRWLEGMYSGGDDGGPRLRLLLLRTLLAHARLWTVDEYSNKGLIQAIQVLLTEVVLVGDEAITVREQASLLLSTLQTKLKASG